MNILKKGVFLTMLTISIVSCKRDYSTSTVMGPANISADSKFAVTAPFSAFVSSMDFSQNIITENFTATFNEKVTWQIVITGERSTAVKTITGTSAVIDGTNSTWTGNHDGLYYFETGETVQAVLTVSGIKDPVGTTTITISKAPSLAATPTFQLINATAGGSGANAFDSDYERPTDMLTNFPPKPSGQLGSQGINHFPTQFNVGSAYELNPFAVLQTDSIRAPEGQYFCRIMGKSHEANGAFVGGLQHRKNANASTHYFPTSWTDPTKIYLNVYVRGIDHLPTDYIRGITCKPYATLNFECHEDDRADLTTAPFSQMSTKANCLYYAQRPTQGTDCFCPSSEDAWVFTIPIMHTGWKLFSCRYSDLFPSADIANGGFGNKILEPQKVCRVQLGLVSSPPLNVISADVDLACFTYGAPLNPNK
jgi:hypothetical protein